ncbi:MAG TPA: sigma-54 dependent transcriptional regulator [Smithellaceae bacterium]|nr:sigma-54 dependent transcriptional regulator [Smithellaceae bacterium]
MAKILIVDDDELFCEFLSSAFEEEGHQVECAYSLETGLQLVFKRPFDVVFLDVMMPDGNGLDKLAEVRDAASKPEVIILTGSGTMNGAELAIKSGAWDYIAKPSSVSPIKLSLMRALQYHEEKIKKKQTVSLRMEGIIGGSLAMKACHDLVLEAASCDANVLITGETGTGKELFAKAIHENSRRASRSFVIVDCASLTPSLTESMLFGYEKGAYTGADASRDGLIKQANGGTLFLDEIGELPGSIQKSFLRVLQERRFRPLGGAKELESDFRLIAATNRDLDRMVAEDLFRNDLLFRIRSIVLEIPPLREHLDDLIDIASYHTSRICKRSHIESKLLSPDFTEALLSYNWPGNVRELVNAMEHAIAAALSAPTLFARHLPSAIRVKLAQFRAFGEAPPEDDSGPALPAKLPPLKDFRKEMYEKAENKYLLQLIEASRGNIEEACRISGLGRARLYELLTHHRLKLANNTIPAF